MNASVTRPLFLAETRANAKPYIALVNERRFILTLKFSPDQIRVFFEQKSTEYDMKIEKKYDDLKCRQKHLMQPDLFFVQQPISFSCFVLG
jgi:hypothetical protein